MPKITPHLKVGGVSGYHSNNTYVMENARHSRIAGCSNLPEGEMYHVKNSLFHNKHHILYTHSVVRA